MERRNAPWQIEIFLNLISAILLWQWGSLARGIPVLVQARDIFLVVWIIGIIVMLIYRFPRGERKATIGHLPLISDTKKVIEMIVISLALVSIFIYVFKDAPFSFHRFLFSMDAPEPTLVLSGIVALLIFGYLTPRIEEANIMSWLPQTLMKWFGHGGVAIGTAMIIGVLASSIIFVLGHISVTEKISITFIVSAFVFSCSCRLINFKYASYTPAQVFHTAFNSYVVGSVIYNLPIYIWVLPIVFVAGLPIFLTLKKR